MTINFVIQSTFEMKSEPDYKADLAAIRQMMERSTKFVSLSGWSGVLAGFYAMLGAYYAFSILQFNPQNWQLTVEPYPIIGVALLVLTATLATAVILAAYKARSTGQKIWNFISRPMLIDMGLPLLISGILLLFFLWHGMAGLLVPISLLGYGMSLYNAGAYTFTEIRQLGYLQCLLGLLALWLIGYSLLIWAIGFGLLHIIYGLYLHYKYERA
jgi:hypothetical protein